MESADKLSTEDRTPLSERVSKTHDVVFVPSGRGKAQCPPNPNFPNGVDLNCAGMFGPRCKVLLPYPAQECGVFTVTCKLCAMSVAATAAGRPDDPRTIQIPCMAQPTTGAVC